MVEDTLSGRRSQTMQNRSASIVSSESDATCFTCCCSPCIGLCYLLCLKRMTVSTRLKIVWIWMISLSLCGGLYLRYNLYGSDTVSITSFDMMPVQKMSTFFCQGVSVETGSVRTPLAVYRLNNKPHINYTHTMYNMSHKFTLYFIQEKMANFHLLEGSSVTITICARYSFTIDVIRGTENYKKFKLSQNSNQKTLRFSSKCSSKKFDVTVTDRYYFILHNLYTHITDLQLVLHKTTFQLNKKESKLINRQWHAFVPLEFNSMESIIYQPILENYQELNVTSKCQPLIIIYVGIFFGGSFFLGLILCYLVKCMCNDPSPLSTEPPENTSPDNPSRTDPVSSFQIHPTAPLPRNENTVSWLPRTQQFPSCPPPSYESLFANSANNDPPPYLSTTTELNGK